MYENLVTYAVTLASKLNLHVTRLREIYICNKLK
jgi:hypothetical protein